MLSKLGSGFGTLALAGLLQEARAQAETPNDPTAPRKTHFDAKARSVIFLYMDGGVSHVDSFDPKPRLDQENGRPFPMKTEPTQFNNIGNTLAARGSSTTTANAGRPSVICFPTWQSTLTT